MNLEKAFDTIDRHAMWHMMIAIKVFLGEVNMNE